MDVRECVESTVVGSALGHTNWRDRWLGQHWPHELEGPMVGSALATRTGGASGWVSIGQTLLRGQWLSPHWPNPFEGLMVGSALAKQTGGPMIGSALDLGPRSSIFTKLLMIIYYSVQTRIFQIAQKIRAFILLFT